MKRLKALFRIIILLFNDAQEELDRDKDVEKEDSQNRVSRAAPLGSP